MIKFLVIAYKSTKYGWNKSIYLIVNTKNIKNKIFKEYNNILRALEYYLTYIVYSTYAQLLNFLLK